MTNASQPMMAVPTVGHSMSPLAGGGNKAFSASITANTVNTATRSVVRHESSVKAPRRQLPPKRPQSKRQDIQVASKPDFGPPEVRDRGESADTRPQAWVTVPVQEAGRKFRPRGFSISSESSSGTSTNWSTKSRYLMAVRAGPTEVPDHILAKHKLFRANDLPSPYTMFYYDETAPNDILLSNDLKNDQKRALKKTFCRTSKKNERRSASRTSSIGGTTTSISSSEVERRSTRHSTQGRRSDHSYVKSAPMGSVVSQPIQPTVVTTASLKPGHNSSTRSSTSSSSSSSSTSSAARQAKPRHGRCCNRGSRTKHVRQVSYTASTLVTVSDSSSSFSDREHSAPTFSRAQATKGSTNKQKKSCCAPRGSTQVTSRAPTHTSVAPSSMAHSAVPTSYAATNGFQPNPLANLRQQGPSHSVSHASFAPSYGPSHGTRAPSHGVSQVSQGQHQSVMHAPRVPQDVSYVHVVPLYASHKNNNTFPRGESFTSSTVKYMTSSSDSYVSSSQYTSTSTSFTSYTDSSTARARENRGKCCKHRCCENNVTKDHSAVLRGDSFTESYSTAVPERNSTEGGHRNPFVHGFDDAMSFTSDHTVRDVYPRKQKECKRNMKYHKRKLYFEADDMRVPKAGGTAYSMLPSYSTSYKNYPVICYDVIQPEDYNGFFRERKAPPRYF